MRKAGIISKNESTGNGLKTHKKIEGKYFLEAGKKTLKTGKQTLIKQNWKHDSSLQ